MSWFFLNSLTLEQHLDNKLNTKNSKILETCLLKNKKTKKTKCEKSFVLLEIINTN